jgi:hypothetical protein
MKMKFSRGVALAFALAAGTAALFANDGAMQPGSFRLLSQAEAIIGRPATPMSYAGVARRNTVVVAPVVVAPRPVYVAPPVVVVAPRPGCYQVVNGYGQLIWRCP